MREQEKKEDIVIVSAIRTPFGKFGGAMREIPSIDLAAMVMKEVITRVDVKPEEVDEINYGSVILAELALETDVPARQASLLAGFPAENISLTMDKACCSSMTALRLGVRAIKAKEANIAMAVGAENMSRTPHLAPGLRWGKKLGPTMLIDCLFELGYTAKGFNPVAVDAGEVALEYGVTREMQDDWALRSQKLYAEAYRKNIFRSEILPVKIQQKKGNTIIIDEDESPRDSNIEALSKLKTVYGSPTITAGNAPPMNSGASAILIMTREEAVKKQLKPLATIVASVPAATEPRGIAVVPAHSIQKALLYSDLSIDDINLIEINEAFAAMPLVSTKILANSDKSKWHMLLDKTNVNGGAIAIGHPVGASGCRLIMTLAHELKRRGGGYGVASICGGLAQGEAVIIRV